MADIQVNLWECITLPLRIAYPVNGCPAQAEGIKPVGESPDVLRPTRQQPTCPCNALRVEVTPDEMKHVGSGTHWL